MVEVKTPLELIESFSFSDLKVDLTEPEIQDENIVYEVVEGEGFISEDTIESIHSEADDQSTQSQGESQIASEGSVAETPELSAEPDPYLDLIGKDLAIIKKNGQRRIGRLVKVVPFKSLTLQLLNGGIEVQIPQEEVERVEFK